MPGVFLCVILGEKYHHDATWVGLLADGEVKKKRNHF